MAAARLQLVPGGDVYGRTQLKGCKSSVHPYPCGIGMKT